MTAAGRHDRPHPFDDDELRGLRFCSYCPRLCRHACPVSHGEASETVTPWGRMRLMNAMVKGQVELDDGLIEPLFHCVSCGRCQEYCKHRVPVAEILAKGRAWLVQKGYRVPAGFVPHAMGGCEVTLASPLEWLPDRTERPAYLPGCSILSQADGVARVLGAMAAAESLGLALSIPRHDRFLGCGFHEWEVGLRELGAASWQAFVARAKAHSGCLTDCGQALWALGSQPIQGQKSRPVHLVAWLVTQLQRLPTHGLDRQVVLHDASVETRRLGLREPLELLVSRVTGCQPGSLFEAGVRARSMGSEGMWATALPQAQARAARMVAMDVADSGADVVVTASGRSRIALMRALKELRRSGELARVVEVWDPLDLLVTSAGHTPVAKEQP